MKIVSLKTRQNIILFILVLFLSNIVFADTTCITFQSTSRFGNDTTKFDNYFTGMTDDAAKQFAEKTETLYSGLDDSLKNISDRLLFNNSRGWKTIIANYTNDIQETVLRAINKNVIKETDETITAMAKYSKASKQAFGKTKTKQIMQPILESRAGKSMLEKEVKTGLDGLAELKTRNISGIDSIANEIETAGRANNATQLKGALTEAEIGARSEYLDRISKARQNVVTSYGKKTDADFVLVDGKFLSVKNDSMLVNAPKTGPSYAKFADELDTLLTYQLENQVTSGVEIVSKTELSDDIIAYLQKLQSSGKNVSWRIIK